MTRLLVLLWMICVLAAAPGSGQEPDRLPARQLNALIREHQDQVDAFAKAYEEVQGQARRDEFFRTKYPPPERLYPRFMALAEKYPTDPAAIDALVWVVTRASADGPEDEATQRKALGILRRDHLASGKLPLVFGAADEEFLRAVSEKSPHRTARGLACYALANQRLKRIRTVTRWRNEHPDWRRTKLDRFEGTALDFLVSLDVERVTKESEKLLEQVVRDFADVPVEDSRVGKTLGEVAKGHLHEIRDLGVGKVAPQLKSVDLDGNAVQLSTLRGRVVVLDVWATWCGPCRAMIPHQRGLVKRLDGKPFTLVSIAVDEKPDTVAEFLKNEPMPWAHWFNGPEGKIVAELNVASFPTVYVLDAKGVIRFRDVRGKQLDEAVDALLKEAAGTPASK